MWHERRRIDIKTGDLPLIAVFNQTELDGGLSFLEFRFGGVLPRDDLAGLRRDGDTGLPLRRLGTLKPAEADEPAEHLVELLLCDGFLEFGTGATKQLILVPIADYRWNGGVSIRFAFFVERVAAHCDEANADGTEHDNYEEDDSENGEEFFHTRKRPNEKEISGSLRTARLIWVERL